MWESNGNKQAQFRRAPVPFQQVQGPGAGANPARYEQGPYMPPLVPASTLNLVAASVPFYSQGLVQPGRGLMPNARKIFRIALTQENIAEVQHAPNQQPRAQLRLVPMPSYAQYAISDDELGGPV